MEERAKNRMRLQAGIELLSTYGLALIIITVVVAVLFFVFNAPHAVAQNLCSFTNGVTCTDVVLGSNVVTHNTIISVYFINQQQYPILNPILFTQINGQNTSFTSCLPSYVKPGGAMVCVTSIPESTTPNQFLSGPLFIRASYCGLSKNITQCSSPTPQTYSGQFSGHTQNNTAINFALKLAAATNTLTANQKDLLTATLNLSGHAIPGATIAFTENNTNFTLSPVYSDTNTNGQAFTYISGNRSGSVKVTATFGGAQNTIVVTLSPSVQITFDLTKFMYCSQNTANILVFQGTGYTCNQLQGGVTIALGKGNYPFKFLNTTPISPSNSYIRDTYQNITFNNVPIYIPNGTIRINTNSIIDIFYNTQYFISALQNPPGSATMVSTYCVPTQNICLNLPQGGGVWATNSSMPHYFYVNESPNFGASFIDLACTLGGCNSIASAGNSIGSSCIFTKPGGGVYTGKCYSSGTFYAFNGPILEAANFQSTSGTTSTTSTSTTSTTTTISQSGYHQQLVPVNAVFYQQYTSNDLGNIRFYSGSVNSLNPPSANELYSWCETGCNSSSYNAVFWLRVPNGMTYITMNILSKGTEYNGISGYAGESPLQSNTYGTFDNGQNVFYAYANGTQYGLPTPMNDSTFNQTYLQLPNGKTGPAISLSVPTIPLSMLQGGTFNVLPISNDMGIDGWVFADQGNFSTGFGVQLNTNAITGPTGYLTAASTTDQGSIYNSHFVSISLTTSPTSYHFITSNGPIDTNNWAYLQTTYLNNVITATAGNQVLQKLYWTTVTNSLVQGNYSGPTVSVLRGAPQVAQEQNLVDYAYFYIYSPPLPSTGASIVNPTTSTTTSTTSTTSTSTTSSTTTSTILPQYVYCFGGEVNVSSSSKYYNFTNATYISAVQSNGLLGSWSTGTVLPYNSLKVNGGYAVGGVDYTSPISNFTGIENHGCSAYSGTYVYCIFLEDFNNNNNPPTTPWLMYYSSISGGSIGTWHYVLTPSQLDQPYITCAASSSYLYCVTGANPGNGGYFESSTNTSLWYAPIQSGGAPGSWTRGPSFGANLLQFPDACFITSSRLYCTSGYPLTNMTWYSQLSANVPANWQEVLGTQASQPNFFADISTIFGGCGLSGSSSNYLYCIGTYNITVSGGVQHSHNANTIAYLNLNANTPSWTAVTSPLVPDYIDAGLGPSCAATTSNFYCMAGQNGQEPYAPTPSLEWPTIYANTLSGGAGSWSTTANYPLPLGSQSCLVGN